MSKLIGQSGNITVSSADYAVSEWSMAVSNDVQEVTDTASGGWAEFLAGINSAELSFTAFWGQSAALISTTFAIGTTVSAICKIGNSGKSFSGAFIVKTFTVKNGAKSPVEFSCTATLNGALTVPS